MRHEHASLALAQRCSAVPSPAPLFSALLNYRHSPGVAQAPTEEAMQAWQGIQGLRGEERTNYPLALSVNDLGEGFSLDAQTPASIGPMRICEFMRTALESLADALESAPSTAVRALEVLPASERHRVLYQWNDTRTEYPSDKCVHQLFEEQVEKSPDATAVVFEDGQLTYAELNTRANQLAHYLIELGIRPDDRVAICVERGFEMIVALLAVLKAGGAYVPLDPAYPIDRLRFMIEDSEPVALLTQSHLAEVVRRHRRRTSDDRFNQRIFSVEGTRRDQPGSRQHRPQLQSPRLCHLYLRIDREPKRRHGSNTQTPSMFDYIAATNVWFHPLNSDAHTGASANSFLRF